MMTIVPITVFKNHSPSITLCMTPSNALLASFIDRHPFLCTSYRELRLLIFQKCHAIQTNANGINPIVIAFIIRSWRISFISMYAFTPVINSKTIIIAITSSSRYRLSFKSITKFSGLSQVYLR